MVKVQLAHPMFAGQCSLQLFQQNQTMAENNHLFTGIKLADDFASQNCFPCPCRGFDNKTPMRFLDIRETVNDFLLPSSEFHLVKTCDFETKLSRRLVYTVFSKR